MHAVALAFPSKRQAWNQLYLATKCSYDVPMPVLLLDCSREKCRCVIVSFPEKENCSCHLLARESRQQSYPLNKWIHFVDEFYLLPCCFCCCYSPASLAQAIQKGNGTNENAMGNKDKRQQREIDKKPVFGGSVVKKKSQVQR